MRQGDRILAAMSGGVDSSVMAALLHHAGYEVIGISMQLFDKKTTRDSDGKCCTLDDFQDARRVAYEMGFPHYVMDFEAKFRDTVIEGFIQGYLNGETPSPCIRCNQHLKFSALMDRANSMDAAFVATGHYSTISLAEGKWHLRKASDAAKDQSYFLFHHTQESLARTLFPLAHLTKPEVRQLGAELGLHLAEKAESQEICFVTQDRYDAFLESEGRDPGRGEGEIRHLDGRVLGHHQGYWRHTIGQRRGLGVASTEPLYVVRIDPDTNTIWLGPESGLMSRDLVARELSWVDGAPAAPIACEARIRSRAPEAEAIVIPLPDGRVKVAFAEPQRAIAPGQAVVFYRDGEVLGGGWIDGR
ncbi:tRNA 2-thiouridine(34) synthase MnmA [Geothrix limicola]|uniref:tRNA 2-thiouridine(34) synthase MnmA n=1 Tax=Geothrix limicola TaxID=2927978 RepID=UPI003B75CE77